MASNPIFDLYVSYGVRALLGGGKGKFIMEDLKMNNPEAYKAVMAEAQKQYDALPDDLKQDRIKGLTQMMSNSLRSMADIVDKELNTNKKETQSI